MWLENTKIDWYSPHWSPSGKQFWSKTMSQESVVVLPPIYYLPALGSMGYGWCLLSEVVQCATALSAGARTNIQFTPESLITEFAALVRNNPRGRQAKIFRFSLDGYFDATEVPPHAAFIQFKLSIDSPYPEGLYVQADWACDTLYMITRGAYKADDIPGTGRVGMRPRGGELIHSGDFINFRRN